RALPPSPTRRSSDLQRDVGVADDRDARLRLQVHPTDVLAEVKLAGDRGWRSGVGRSVRQKLAGIPRRPGAAKVGDASGIAARAIERVRRPVSRGRNGPWALRQCTQSICTIHARTHNVRLIVEDEYV